MITRIKELLSNRIRIIGFAIFLTGIVLNYIFENQSSGYYEYVLMGLGLGLMILGKEVKFKSN